MLRSPSRAPRPHPAAAATAEDGADAASLCPKGPSPSSCPGLRHPPQPQPQPQPTPGDKQGATAALERQPGPPRALPERGCAQPAHGPPQTPAPRTAGGRVLGPTLPPRSCSCHHPVPPQKARGLRFRGPHPAAVSPGFSLKLSLLFCSGFCEEPGTPRAAERRPRWTAQWAGNRPCPTGSQPHRAAAPGSRRGTDSGHGGRGGSRGR